MSHTITEIPEQKPAKCLYCGQIKPPMIIYEDDRLKPNPQVFCSIDCMKNNALEALAKHDRRN